MTKSKKAAWTVLFVNFMLNVNADLLSDIALRKEKNYFCHLNCKGEHVVCLATDRSCGVHQRCPDELRIQSLSTDDRDLIISLHNEFRHRFASGQNLNKIKVSNMNFLSYDLELEYVAQCRTNSCRFKQVDYCRVTRDFKSVGQNYYMGNYSFIRAETLQFSISSWYKDRAVANFTTNIYNDTIHKTISKFTQGIWATVTHIGCGKLFFGKRLYMICHYGPGGNENGQPIFQIGEPCTNCTKGDTCNKNLTSLCGSLKPLKSFEPPFELNAASLKFTIYQLLISAAVCLFFQ